MRAAERVGLVKEGGVEVAVGAQRWHCEGKSGEWERGAQRWRHTVIHALCWDDWEGGGREQVQATMDRR